MNILKRIFNIKTVFILLGTVFFLIGYWAFETHRLMLLHKSILPGIVMFVCVWIMD